MPNRAKAQAFIYKFVKDLDPSGYNTQQYEKIFANMSDKAFDEYMQGLRDGAKYLVAFKPPFEGKGITLDNNLAIAPKYKVNFFQQLIISNDRDLPPYKTPIEYMVLDLPIRRQSQNLIKKISIPENNKIVDQLTGQPTGASKGAKISYPELQILNSMGLDKSLEELFKYKGGDKGGLNAFNTMFMKYGSANLKTLSNYSTGVESGKTLKAYLLGMHVKSSI